MADNTFFEESREQSEVKAAIVAGYFDTWARIMLMTQKKYGRDCRIAYIDLFCGPGRYKNGTKSTPLLILEKAIESPELRESLVTIFNDRDQDNVSSLAEAIASLAGVESLAFAPQVLCQDVGEDIAKQLEAMHLIPTFLFADPWGYRGLSQRLINSVVKDWGCDAVFFFNYNRINAGLGNDLVKQHMDALFGQARADALRCRLEPLQPYQRELAIVEELAQALKEMGAKYVLPFRFLNDRGTRTSHYLIFVTKHFRGYEKMKEVMASQVSREAQGVPQFQYAPAEHWQMLLFEPSRPLDELAEMLVDAYAGKTLTMQQIYESHSVDRPFIKKNYKAALCDLESQGRIRADPPAVDATGKKRRGFADDIMVTFPKRG